MSGPRIFISYALEDVEVARRFGTLLRNAGYEPWLDRKDLAAGTPLTPEIRRAMAEADLFIPILTDEYARKFELGAFVRKEAELAFQIAGQLAPNEVFVVPVRIRSSQVPTSFMGSERAFQSYDGPADEPGLLRSVFRALESRGRLGIEITVIAGPDAGRIFRKALTLITIGRADGSDVRLNDPAISAGHAQIQIRRRAVMIRDISSSRTLVQNPQRKEILTQTATRAFHGDVVRLGESELRLAFEGVDLGRLVATTTRKS